MSKDNNLHDFLQDVADAIREKKGTSDKINAQRFAEEIRSIESGGGSGDNGLADALVKRTITEYINPINGIGTNAFRECYYLTKVVLPNALLISTAAFYNCTGLVDIDAPKVKHFSAQAFYGCTGLTKVAFPSATNVASNQYRLCSNLAYIDAGVTTSIAANAFLDCTSLTTLILRSPTICTLNDTNVFKNSPIASGNGSIYVPDDLVEAYKGATNWSTFASQIKPMSELPNE